MDDRELIERVGAAKLAAALGFDKKQGGVQRVWNWRMRGIPAAVRLQHGETLSALQASAAETPATPATEGARDAA